jgi:hypothetical protein
MMGAYFLDHVGSFMAGFTQRQYATLPTVESKT